jgi:hypothetical protein
LKYSRRFVKKLDTIINANLERDSRRHLLRN